MKRLLLLVLVCVLAPITAHAQTAVTGNLKDVGVANASGSNTYVRFTLIDYGAQIPRIINLAGNVVFNPIKDFKPDVNGNISGVIQGNDTISPPATKYQVCIFYQGAVFRCNTYIINGATFNLNTAVPLNTSIQAGANQLVVLSFPFTQATPASTWTIPHNFNDPNAYVQVFSTTHQIIYPDTVNTSDPNNAVLTFVTPTAGFAIAMHAGSINIATNQPNAIISNPTGSQEIGGGQLFTFDGPVTFTQPATLSALWNFNAGINSSGPNTFNGGGTFSGTWVGTPILSALWTFNGGLTSTGANILSGTSTVLSNSNVTMQLGAANGGSLAALTLSFDATARNFIAFQDLATLSNHHSYITGPAACGTLNTFGIFDQTALKCAFSYAESTGNSSITKLNNIRFADQFPGATADVQINAAISDLPANGGTVDARGYGATTQTVAATVTVGTNTKTVTLLVDRTTTFNCTITNNTPCFKKGAGSAMVGLGSAITNPNAGITFGASAAISAAIFDQQQSGGNFVGSHLDGISIFGNATMTVSDALVALQCPLQVTNYKNLNIAGLGLTNSIMLKIYGTTACGGGNVDVSNTQIECSGATGCKPVWIGCASAGSTTLVACPAGISNMSFNGKGSAYVHPGSGGIPIFDIECGNGAGGTNTCGSFEFSGLQVESRNAGDFGILANGPESIHVYGLTGTCATTCGADLVRVAQPAGTQLDGVDVRGLDNQGGWTNTLNNTLLGRTFSFANFTRLNYSYAGSNRVQTVIDGGPQAMGGQAFATLGTPANGTFTFCSDCTIANPCAGGGTGAMAKRLNGVWVCN